MSSLAMRYWQILLPLSVSSSSPYWIVLGVVKDTKEYISKNQGPIEHFGGSRL